MQPHKPGLNDIILSLPLASNIKDEAYMHQFPEVNSPGDSPQASLRSDLPLQTGCSLHVVMFYIARACYQCE